MNIFTIPLALMLVLAGGLLASLASPKAKLDVLTCNSKYFAPCQQKQTREDIAQCGHGPVSFTGGWCIQWQWQARMARTM